MWNSLTSTATVSAPLSRGRASFSAPLSQSSPTVCQFDSSNSGRRTKLGRAMGWMSGGLGAGYPIRKSNCLWCRSVRDAIGSTELACNVPQRSGSDGKMRSEVRHPHVQPAETRLQLSGSGPSELTQSPPLLDEHPTAVSNVRCRDAAPGQQLHLIFERESPTQRVFHDHGARGRIHQFGLIEGLFVFEHERVERGERLSSWGRRKPPAASHHGRRLRNRVVVMASRSSNTSRSSSFAAESLASSSRS